MTKCVERRRHCPRRDLSGAGGALLVVLSVAWALAAVTGCGTTSSAANLGHDLVENPGWTHWVRVPAGLGQAAGYTLAVPVSVVLLPSYLFDSAVVRSAQGYEVTSSGGQVEEGKGDIWIPLVQAPYEYMGGIGSTVIGSPFWGVYRIFARAPGPPEGTVREDLELRPSEEDPELRFTVTPPAATGETAPAVPQTAPAVPQTAPAVPQTAPAVPDTGPDSGTGPDAGTAPPTPGMPPADTTGPADSGGPADSAAPSAGAAPGSGGPGSAGD